MVNFGWGLAVFAGVLVSYVSGAHLNPAVTHRPRSSRGTIDFAMSALAALHRRPAARRDHRRGARLARVQAALRRGARGRPTSSASSRPAPRSAPTAGTSSPRSSAPSCWCSSSSASATTATPTSATPGGLAALGALPVALLVVGIGASLGGPTGYAINPARDLGPRIAHALLPIKGKGSSDWSYSWVPVVGPLIGGVLAGLLAPVLLASPADHADRTTHPAQRYKGEVTMADYVIAIDQGTTSTRAIIFDHEGQRSSRPARRSTSRSSRRPAGSSTTRRRSGATPSEVIGQALTRADITRHDIAAVGITNQRETAVVWDKNTGKPVYNAIVWQDTRTQAIVDRLAADGGVERFKHIVGLPLATYFSGTKIVWILENVEGAREKAEAGDLLFGTTDTLGALEPHRRHRRRRARDRRHQRLAARCSWTSRRCSGTTTSSRPSASRSRCCPRSAPPPRSTATSSRRRLLREVPIAGILGDQQAATFGQAAFDAGREQEHLRHRQLPDLQHRRGDRPLEERAAHDGRLQARRRPSRTTRWRARSPSPVR